jgi:SagB-type dehydrogenase family enzyme
VTFPAYAYIPGHWPHPTRDTDGHSFGRGELAPLRLDPRAWRANATFTRGLELFDAGYYWEAHEAWEALWVGCDREGPTADLLSGLIKIAAAGIKIRQGNASAAARLATRATESLQRAEAAGGSATMAGLSFSRLQVLARQAENAHGRPSSGGEPVVVVFDGGLGPEVDGDSVRPVVAGTSSLALTLDYHRRTKHRPFRFASSLGYMDWATQPDPFRRFTGAPQVPLRLTPVGAEPRFEAISRLGRLDSEPLTASTVARLFQDALSLSAWKEGGGNRWALRVNPSSGNLHPTEGYLIAGPIVGLGECAAVYHYNAHDHVLERRANVPSDPWIGLTSGLPEGALLIGLTSIHWREAWKYGERAFRYCQHDVGHALAAIAIAAAGLGWDARLAEGVVDEALAALLGIDRQHGPEAEHPDCLIVVLPGGTPPARAQSLHLDATLTAAMRSLSWLGSPNELSSDHHDWPAIGAVAAATLKSRPPTAELWGAWRRPNDSLEPGDSTLPLRQVIHQRRSAVALDGRTGITRDAFFQILLKTVPGAGQVPFTALPWRPRVDLLLFVHRIRGIPPGLYVLVRDPGRVGALRNAMDSTFDWRRPQGCPDSLQLFLLELGDARRAARQTSCDQAIASDGVFAVAMLAEYLEPLQTYGPWFYRRLHWEAGVIGQVLYLEAEATGIRGTGIGCFFDDLSHGSFGLESEQFQVLYHFTLGGAVDDTRLSVHPPYEHLDDREIGD